MNNPGIDLKIWEPLREKLETLVASGHKVQVRYELIKDPHDLNKVLIIDVIQKIDDEIVTETVQKNTYEASKALGIHGLSMEDLITLYKKRLRKVHREAGVKRKTSLVVTMFPSSLTSGEIKAVLQEEETTSATSVLVGYIDYYILNALRERMIDLVGDAWSKVKVIYYFDEVEFYFEYSA